MQWRNADDGRFAAPLPIVAVVGALGACLVGLAAWHEGPPSNPASWLPALQHLPSSLQRHTSALGRVGVFVLVVAWFGLRRLSIGKAISPRLVLVVAFVWMVPLLLVPPVQSNDAFVYVANGRLVERGLDPGEHKPEDLGDDPILQDVAPGWQVVVTGYGPASTLVSEITSRVTGDNIEAALLGWRLWVLGSVGLLALGVTVLARAYEVDLADALVLAVAGPLTVVHLVGGVHNDALMVGLLACGLAVRRRVRRGTADSSSVPRSAGSAPHSRHPRWWGPSTSAGPAASLRS